MSSTNYIGVKYTATFKYNLKSEKSLFTSNIYFLLCLEEVVILILKILIWELLILFFYLHLKLQREGVVFFLTTLLKIFLYIFYRARKYPLYFLEQT